MEKMFTVHIHTWLPLQNTLNLFPVTVYINYFYNFFKYFTSLKSSLQSNGARQWCRARVWQSPNADEQRRQSVHQNVPRGRHRYWQSSDNKHENVTLVIWFNCVIWLWQKPLFTHLVQNGWLTLIALFLCHSRCQCEHVKIRHDLLARLPLLFTHNGWPTGVDQLQDNSKLLFRGNRR
jgi:hypothetical protein